jgi:type IV pilus assembly protein PilE
MSNSHRQAGAGSERGRVLPLARHNLPPAAWPFFPRRAPPVARMCPGARHGTIFSTARNPVPVAECQVNKVSLAGFTLIELMIVVAIVGILAAVAYPSYLEHVQRGKISEATATLADLRVKLEQYYQDNRNYGSDGAKCGGTAGPPDTRIPAATVAGAQSFGYTCASRDGTGQTFLLTATGVAAQGMTGFAFTVDERNNRRTPTFAGTTVNATCWLTKKGGSC